MCGQVAAAAVADGLGRRAQEVQSNHFTEFLAPELQKHGYTAIYKKKTTEIYTGSAYAIDGCATFFRRDRFALVKKYEARAPHARLLLGARFSPSLPCKELAHSAALCVTDPVGSA